ncbi:hypothetical protein MXM66_23735, partial [Enterobacter roggenkampii]|nr:hypothetical protein [Enterobacter roggenkampii]
MSGLTLTGSGLPTDPVLTEGSGAPGTYTTTLTPTVAGMKTLGTGGLGSFNLTTTLNVSAFFTGISVNNFNFPMNSSFPTTGFVNGYFNMNISGGQANDFIWSVNQTWLSVTNGLIRINVEPTSGTNTVIITATPKQGGTPATYTFTLQKWFIAHPGRQTKIKTDAINYCASLNATLPTRAELTAGRNVRAVQALYSEWGDISNYAEISGMAYRAIDVITKNNSSGVQLIDGLAYNIDNNTRYPFYCKKNL